MHMHIKYDMPINLDEVVYLFEGLHAWMMQLQSLPYETERSCCELIITVAGLLSQYILVT